MSKRCYYETLSVSRTANDGELKTAYRKLAMQWHPDRNPGDKDCEHKFKEINEAYDVLKDGDKRAAYDRFGHAAFENGHGASAAARLRFGFRVGLLRYFRRRVRHGRRAQRRRVRGASAGRIFATTWRSRSRMPISGKAAELRIPTSVTCETCSGIGAKPGTKPKTCSTCGGAGKIRHAQGFFTLERTCPVVSRPRPGDRRSLQVLLGFGPRHARAHACR